MPRLSERIRDLRASPIRALLERTQNPEIISFAGGLPAADSFDDLVLPLAPVEMLQYGPTEGERPLREKIAEELAAIGLPCPADRILILSGSQQGIDLTAKLMVDTGTTVAIESPAYLAALQVFSFMGARFAPIDRADPAATLAGRRATLAYVTPTFQNPTGHCWTTRERDALADACDANDTLLFEDDPYRDLVYDPCERRPICAGLMRASWIYQGSFSKTIAPGLRIGFLAASADLYPHLVKLKQAADLHTNRMSQWMVLQHLNDPARHVRLAGLVDRYRQKRDLFAAAMTRHLTGLADWEVPPGGLFFWATLRGQVDTEALLERALERKVAFMPGGPFQSGPGPHAPAIRLNFSHASSEAAERGLAVIGELLAEAARQAA